MTKITPKPRKWPKYPETYKMTKMALKRTNLVGTFEDEEVIIIIIIGQEYKHYIK